MRVACARETWERGLQPNNAAQPKAKKEHPDLSGDQAPQAPLTWPSDLSNFEL